MGVVTSPVALQIAGTLKQTLREPGVAESILYDEWAEREYIRQLLEREAKGEAKGKAEGEAKGFIEAAMLLIRKNKSVEEVTGLLDLSKEQLKLLTKELGVVQI